MPKVMIDRELLERVAKPVLFRSNEDAHADACAELRAILAAPRQPEGDGLEVVAWLGGNGFHTEEKEATGSPFPLCHLYAAQHALAELREVNRIQLEIAEVHGAACVEIRKERDNLRQQLADLRNQLLKNAEQSLKATELLAATLAQRDKLAGLLQDALKLGELGGVLSLRNRVMTALVEVTSKNKV